MFFIVLLFYFLIQFFHSYKNINKMNLSKGLDNIFVLFTKFKLQKLPKVKLMTSSKYWVLFCVIAAIKSTQYLNIEYS